MKKIIIFISLIIINGTFMYGQKEQFKELANKAVEKFSSTISEQNYKYFGLSSLDAIKNLEPDKAIVHYAVGLKELQSYSTDKDPNEIIKEMGYVTVPLINKEKNSIETFVFFEGTGDKYTPVGMGQAPYALKYIEIKTKEKLGQETKLIRIPALNLAYAGIMVEGVLNLMPIVSKDQRSSELMPAADVFAELSKKTGKGYGDVPH